MPGETNLLSILGQLKPRLNKGEYVFCSVDDSVQFVQTEILGSIREKEGLSLIISKQYADTLHLAYDFISAWITIDMRSSLSAVGLTAVLSKALGEQLIACNVVAGFYHDHIFVAKKDVKKAMQVLRRLSKR